MRRGPQIVWRRCLFVLKCLLAFGVGGPWEVWQRNKPATATADVQTGGSAGLSPKKGSVELDRVHPRVSSCSGARPSSNPTWNSFRARDAPQMDRRRWRGCDPSVQVSVRSPIGAVSAALTKRFTMCTTTIQRSSSFSAVFQFIVFKSQFSHQLQPPWTSLAGETGSNISERRRHGSVSDELPDDQTEAVSYGLDQTGLRLSELHSSHSSGAGYPPPHPQTPQLSCTLSSTPPAW